MRHGITKYLLIVVFSIGSVMTLMAQETGTIKGFVYDKSNGEPIIFTNVVLKGTTYGASTDVNGYFSIDGVPAGDYVLQTTYLGYDTAQIPISLSAGEVVSKKVYLKKGAIQMETVQVSAQSQEARTETKVSATKITPQQINKIPAAGAEADLAQYLQVLPGVVFTGEQGGQLYIRGGTPIQTKMLLDGMTIYNPFHSIGFFSVFETDIIRNVNVKTGGFGAEHGDRISAIIDIETRDGNKKKFAGKVSTNPFLSKVLFEGPIKKLTKEGGSNASFIFTAKHSYLNKSSKLFYQYMDERKEPISFNDLVQDPSKMYCQTCDGLPYKFTDLYGKVSFNTANGSKFNLFGFNYNDFVNFQQTSKLQWNNLGFGTDFVIVPGQSEMLIEGNFSYSDYGISLDEGDNQPRQSSISGFDLGMDFTYFLENGEIKYGVDVAGFKTNFEFFNPADIKFEQNQSTTELAGYIKYREVFGDWVVEPSLRLQYYGSLNVFSPEPRFALKYNVTDYFRLKTGGGLYSQNLISTVSDQDVVRLFSGFLSGPTEQLKRPNGEVASNNLQRAIHSVLGAEYNITEDLLLEVEGYYKRFTQLININRYKLFPDDPDYKIETGDAYGGDVLLKYEHKRWYGWMAYTLGWIKRHDGTQTYPPHFDRRHNLNLVGSYTFGKNLNWEVNARWNLGTGFPFTKTQGFYQNIRFNNGINTNYTTQNVSNPNNLGIIYGPLNQGRLPTYHRLDLSLKRTFALTVNTKLQAQASITNVYNRRNIFYIDRFSQDPVYQLPIMPSIGLTLDF